MVSAIDRSRSSSSSDCGGQVLDYDMATFQSCLKKLNAIDAAKLQSSPELRSDAVLLAQKLADSVESPDQVAMRYAYEMSSQRMAVRFAVDLGIFQKLCQNKQSTVDSSTLSRACGCEELLLVRMMRSLTAQGLVAEAGPKLYKATRLTESFTKASIASTLIVCHNYSGAIQGRAHEYLRKNGYRCPTSASDGPFQWYFGTDKSYFDYVYASPEMPAIFSTMMAGVKLERKHWSEWFPVEREVLRGAEASLSPLVVDVGGAKGDDLIRLVAAFPQMRNRLVLQDLPEVIEGLRLDGIRCMAHDFFQPQPVTGARVYYLHFILHDWPDHQVVLILENIRAAMKKGYSKLLLNEHVMPEQGATARMAAMDLNMMCNFGGLERSESHWSDLLQQAGLRLTSVWKSPGARETEGIIEAEKC